MTSSTVTCWLSILAAWLLTACGSSGGEAIGDALDGAASIAEGANLPDTARGGPMEESAYADLFEATGLESVTPGVLVGLWGASATASSGVTADVRLDFTSSRLTQATRCRLPTDAVLFTGVDVAIRMDTDTITILEAKEERKTSGGYYCQSRLQTGEISYTIDEFNLSIDSATLVKIRD